MPSSSALNCQLALAAGGAAHAQPAARAGLGGARCFALNFLFLDIMRDT
ncbi:MAG: hypothetical protein LBT47_09685 [Deltaproteobacteria bacterium]|nr:hypothetical protein [Deltaproteobacteria bacterium]